MKYIIYLLCLSTLLNCVHLNAQPQLDLKLFLFNSELKPLDPIISVVKIENLVQIALTINYLYPNLYSTAVFQVKSKGKPQWENVKSIKDNNNLERLSHGTFTKYQLAGYAVDYRLNNFIGVSSAYGKSTLEELDWEPGDYELRMVYKYNEKMDSIVSNVVEFRVIPFKGSELQYYNSIKSNPQALVLIKPFFSNYATFDKEPTDTPFLTQEITETYFKKMCNWYLLTLKNMKTLLAFGSKSENVKFNLEEILKTDIDHFILDESYNRVLAQMAFIRKIHYIGTDEENFNQNLLESVLSDLAKYPQLNNEYITNLLSKYKKF